MSRQQFEEIKPFISVLLIVMTLLGVVFFKMEIRRVGYSVLKLSREEKRLKNQQREHALRLAKIVRPERLQSLAQSQLTLKKASKGQIIQMTNQGIALRQ